MRAILFIVVALAVVFLTVACEKTGELVHPPLPDPAVGPTISGLLNANTILSRANGGILRLACSWASPWVVSTATSHLAFVRSLLDGQATPAGVIGSGPVSEIATPAAGSPGGGSIATPTAIDPLASPAAFFARFRAPLTIPVSIGTDQRGGFVQLDIPFPTADIRDAPLGRQQLLFWMTMNGRKTNSLAFEVEFAP